MLASVDSASQLPEKLINDLLAQLMNLKFLSKIDIHHVVRNSDPYYYHHQFYLYEHHIQLLMLMKQT